MSDYRFRLMSSWSMLSTVVMILELAWNPLSVVIILTNSAAMSTLDCSSELEEILPRPFSPGWPVMASPESRVALQRLPPTLERACWLLN